MNGLSLDRKSRNHQSLPVLSYFTFVIYYIKVSGPSLLIESTDYNYMSFLANLIRTQLSRSAEVFHSHSWPDMHGHGNATSVYYVCIL